MNSKLHLMQRMIADTTVTTVTVLRLNTSVVTLLVQLGLRVEDNVTASSPENLAPSSLLGLHFTPPKEPK